MINTDYSTTAAAQTYSTGEVKDVAQTETNTDASVMDAQASNQGVKNQNALQEKLDFAEDVANNIFNLQSKLEEVEAACPGADSPDFQDWLQSYDDAQKDYKAQVADILQYSGISPAYSDEVTVEMNEAKAKLDDIKAACPGADSPDYQEWLALYKDAKEEYRYTLADIVDFYRLESAVPESSTTNPGTTPTTNNNPDDPSVNPGTTPSANEDIPTPDSADGSQKKGSGFQKFLQGAIAVFAPGVAIVGGLIELIKGHKA